MGHIELIIGPMFAGKTTELLRRIQRYHFSNLKCLLIKNAQDTRYNLSNVVSHDMTTCIGIPTVVRSHLMGYTDDCNYDVIGIDEGQFFAEDILEFADTMANNGKIVIIAALDGNFKRQPFQAIVDMVPLSEHVIKLSAVCVRCFNTTAAFSKRTSSETAICVVGGKEKYIAVCRACYHDKQ